MEKHMVTRAFNTKKELNDYVNMKLIAKDAIISIFIDVDKTYVLMYYE